MQQLQERFGNTQVVASKLMNLVPSILCSATNVSFDDLVTVGVNIKFPYRLKETVVLRHTNVLKTVTIYRFYGVHTVTIFTRHFLSPPKSINEKSRSNRRTRAKLARREAINRREEHKQSTD